MSARSYEVNLVLEDQFVGFVLLCFEGDDIVFEQFYRSSEKAEAIGEKFLSGLFLEGFDYREEYISV